MKKKQETYTLKKRHNGIPQLWMWLTVAAIIAVALGAFTVLTQDNAVTSAVMGKSLSQTSQGESGGTLNGKTWPQNAVLAPEVASGEEAPGEAPGDEATVVTHEGGLWSQSFTIMDTDKTMVTPEATPIPSIIADNEPSVVEDEAPTASPEEATPSCPEATPSPSLEGTADGIVPQPSVSTASTPTPEATADEAPVPSPSPAAEAAPQVPPQPSAKGILSGSAGKALMAVTQSLTGVTSALENKAASTPATEDLTPSPTATPNATPTPSPTATPTVETPTATAEEPTPTAAAPSPSATPETSVTTQAAPTIITEALADAKVGEEYIAQLAATGAGTITWSITDGYLPLGLTLTTEGLISGTPEVGSDNLQYTITLEASNGTEKTSRVLTLKVTSEKPVFTTKSLADAKLGEAYSAKVEATGAKDIVYTVLQANGLPTGLTLDEKTGAISGTPTVYETKFFTIKATNTQGSASINLSINVTAEGPRITTDTLPDGKVGEAYNQTIKATGYTPITWKVVGTLPAGLTLDEKTGVISGTPTKKEIIIFGIRAENVAGYYFEYYTVEITASSPSTTAAAGATPSASTVTNNNVATGLPGNHQRLPMVAVLTVLSLVIILGIIGRHGHSRSH